MGYLIGMLAGISGAAVFANQGEWQTAFWAFSSALWATIGLIESRYAKRIDAMWKSHRRRFHGD